MNQSKKLELLANLKKEAGNHSPSLKEIEMVLGEGCVKYDACFLSNPYATKLIYDSEYVNIINKNLYKIIESYPANQKFIIGKLSKIEGVDTKNTIAFNGAQQAIEILLSKLNYKNCLIPIPTFSSYYESIKSSSHTHFLKLEEKNSFKPVLKQFEDSIVKNKIDLLILINPNNPTGLCFENSFIENLSAMFPKLKIIIDESFIHFIGNLKQWQIFKNDILDLNKNIFFIKSLSKDLGIAGLRIGYLQSNNPVMHEINSKFGTWVLNNFAVELLNLMSNQNFIDNYEIARKKFLKAKTDFYRELKKIRSFETFGSESNFFLIKCKADVDSGFKSAMKLLIRSGLYIRTMEDKIGLNKQFFRVASRSKSENEMILKILSNYEF